MKSRPLPFLLETMGEFPGYLLRTPRLVFALAFIPFLLFWSCGFWLLWRNETFQFNFLISDIASNYLGNRLQVGDMTLVSGLTALELGGVELWVRDGSSQPAATAEHVTAKLLMHNGRPRLSVTARGTMIRAVRDKRGILNLLKGWKRIAAEAGKPLPIDLTFNSDSVKVSFLDEGPPITEPTRPYASTALLSSLRVDVKGPVVWGSCAGHLSTRSRPHIAAAFSYDVQSGLRAKFRARGLPVRSIADSYLSRIVSIRTGEADLNASLRLSSTGALAYGAEIALKKASGELPSIPAALSQIEGTLWLSNDSFAARCAGKIGASPVIAEASWQRRTNQWDVNASSSQLSPSELLDVLGFDADQLLQHIRVSSTVSASLAMRISNGKPVAVGTVEVPTLMWDKQRVDTVSAQLWIDGNTVAASSIKARAVNGQLEGSASYDFNGEVGEFNGVISGARLECTGTDALKGLSGVISVRGTGTFDKSGSIVAQGTAYGRQLGLNGIAIEDATANVGYVNGNAYISSFQVALAGGGALRGSAEWRNGELEAFVSGRAINPSNVGLHPSDLDIQGTVDAFAHIGGKADALHSEGEVLGAGITMYGTFVPGLRAAVAWDGRAVDISGVIAFLGGGEVSGYGSVAKSPAGNGLLIQAEGTALGVSPRIAKRSESADDALLDGRFFFWSDQGNWNAYSSVTATDVILNSVYTGEWRSEASAENNRIKLNPISIDLLGDTLVGWANYETDGRIFGELLGSADIGLLGQWKPEMASVQGKADIRVTLGGSQEAPIAQFALQANELKFPSGWTGKADLVGVASKDKIALGEALLSGGEGEFRLDEGSYIFSNGAYEAKGSLKDLPLMAMMSVSDLLYSTSSSDLVSSKLQGLTGSLEGSFNVGGDSQSPADGVVSLNLRNLKIRDVAYGDGAVDIRIANNVVDVSTLRLQNGVSIVSAQGSYTPQQGFNLAVVGREVAGDLLTSLLGGERDASYPSLGRVDFDLAVAGKNPAVLVTGSAVSRSGRVSGQAYESIALSDIAVGGGKARTAFLARRGVNSLSGWFEGSLLQGFRLDENGPIAGQIDVAPQPLTPLVEGVSRIRSLDGSVEGSLTISGTYAKPSVGGYLQLSDLSADFLGLDQQFHLSPSRIAVEDGRATWSAQGSLGPGSIAGQASLQLDGVHPQSLSAHLELQPTFLSGRNLSGYYQERFTGGFTGSLDVNGDWLTPNVTGKFSVSRGEISFAKPIGPPPAQLEPTFRPVLDLQLETTTPIVWQSALAEASLSGGMRILGPIDRLQVSGEASIVGGLLYYFGAQFRLIGGSVSMSYLPPEDPAFLVRDATAQARVAGHDITMRASGSFQSADGITPTFESSPPLSRPELYGLLGIPGEGLTTFDSQVLSSQLQKALSIAALPTIEPLLRRSLSLEYASIDLKGGFTLERQIARGFSLRYQRSQELGAEGSFWQITWRVNPKTRLSYGSDPYQVRFLGLQRTWRF